MKKRKLILPIVALLMGFSVGAQFNLQNKQYVKDVLREAPSTVTYTFTSKSWADSTNTWTSGKSGNSLQDGRGVQVTTGTTKANATSKNSFTNVSQVVITYSTNASSGAGSISVKIGNNDASSKNVTKTGGTTDRTLEYNFTQNQTGTITFTVTCTTNSIYVKSIAITSGGTASGQQAINNTKPVGNLVFRVNTQVHELEGYEKVTSEPADWSGEYILVCENEKVCFDGSLEQLDVSNNTVDVKIFDSFIGTNTNIDAATFTINEIDGGFSIQASNGEYIGQTSNANGLVTSNDAIVNTIEFANNGDVNIVSRSAYLRYNSASNQNRFRYYKSSSYTAQQAIQLYKKTTTTKQITTHTPQNTKVNLGAIFNRDNILDIQDKVVSYGVAVAKQEELGTKKLSEVLNEPNVNVGKSEVTLANTPFVYCDSQGRAPGDTDYVDNTDYIIFSANLAVPEANYTTELTWAAYFILNDDSVVMTEERTESVKSLAIEYQDIYGNYDEDVKACIDYLASAE